jgi:hypothetical protein
MIYTGSPTSDVLFCRWRLAWHPLGIQLITISGDPRPCWIYQDDNIVTRYEFSSCSEGE